MLSNYATLLAADERQDVDLHTASTALPHRSPPPQMEEIGYLSREDKPGETFGLYGQRIGGRYEYHYRPQTGHHGGASRIALCAPRGRELWTGDKVKLPSHGPLWTVTLHGPRVTLG
jgi:hypothetical protein